MKPGFPAPPVTGRVYGMMGANEMQALGAMHSLLQLKLFWNTAGL